MTSKTGTEGLETQNQHVVVPCDSVTPTTHVMHPTSTTTGATSALSLSCLGASGSACVWSATMTQASQSHGSAKVALTSDVPSMADVASLETDQQVMSDVVGQPKGTLQAAIMSAQASVAGGRRASTNESGVGPIDTTDPQQRTLLTVLEPGPFLLHFMQQLDSNSMLALFGGCTATRDMVLRDSHSVGVGGHVLDEQAHQHLLQALQLASKHGSNLSLTLNKSADEYDPVFDPAQSPEKVSCWPGRCTPQLVKAQEQLSTRSYALVQEGQCMGILQGVSSLDLTGVYLESPLPAVLGRAFPNLRTLTLCRGLVKFSQQGGTANMDAFTTAYPNLQTLRLHDVGWSGPIKKWRQQLSQQFAQLPSLTSLSLTHSSWEACDRPYDDDDMWEIETDYGQLYGTITDEVLAAAASQLTHLELDWYDEMWSASRDEGGMNSKRVWSKLDMGSRLSAVRTLIIDMKPQDADMVQLLALQQLTHLSVRSFELTRSFAGHQCCWQVLELCVLRVEDLAWLPLHTGLEIKAPSHNFAEQSRANLFFNIQPFSKATVEEAMANITQAAWPGWRNTRMEVTAEPSWDHHLHKFVKTSEVSMVSALPLLAGVSHLLLGQWRLTPVGLGALGAFAAKQQHGFHLEVHSSCTWTHADMLNLVSRMPASSHLTVSRTDEKTFTQLCFAAKRHVTMHAKFSKQAQAGFCERLKEALAARGQLDTLVTDAGRVQTWNEGLCWEWVVKGQ